MAETDVGINHSMAETDVGISQKMAETDIGFRHWGVQRVLRGEAVRVDLRTTDGGRASTALYGPRAESIAHSWQLRAGARRIIV